jgi:predicted NUDIX family NTP pyrophosphohydrolase
MKKISAGLLMYRKKDHKIEVLLVHPGGPFYKNKDDGVWDIPKGEAEEGESDLLKVAQREFEEETSFKVTDTSGGGVLFRELGFVEKPNKIVHIWAFEGDCDYTKIKSNTTKIEWPPRSGKMMEIPEVDRAEFFTLDEAKKKVWPFLVPILERLTM